MLRFNVTFLVSFLLISCVSKENTTLFEREDMLIRYINDKTDLESNKEFSLVLVNSSDCSACNIEDIVDVQKNEIYKRSKQRYFFFTSEKEELLNDLTDSTAEVVFIKMNELDKYGLRFFTTHIFYINESKIVEWDKINF